MILEELDISPEYKLLRILKVMENIYGISIDFDVLRNESDLKRVYENYDNIRQNIIRESEYNSYNQDPEYTKAYLLQEVIGLFLREIAQKRLTRRQNGSRCKEQT